jgi:GntR family transcriptional regulator, carbon starvation induced regulator
MTVQALRSRKEFGKTIAADLAHRLKEDIITCRLKPGESLKFEDLRNMFPASFSTLREALISLVADGLVINEQQRGFHVAPATKSELIDITEARVLIEIDTLRKSITLGGDDWEIGVMSALHRLNRIEERTSVNLAEDPNWRKAHSDFHFALVSACGSPTLLSIRSNLFDRSERFRSLSAAFRPRSRDKSGEHRALMNAAIARDSEQAVLLIERHIRATTANVVEYAPGCLGEISEAKAAV